MHGGASEIEDGQGRGRGRVRGKVHDLSPSDEITPSMAETRRNAAMIDVTNPLCLVRERSET
jgi:hypothetical protein